MTSHLFVRRLTNTWPLFSSCVWQTGLVLDNHKSFCTPHGGRPLRVNTSINRTHKRYLSHDPLRYPSLDFGLSNCAGILGYSDPFSTQCGSPAYAAPELLSRKKYGPKVDVWSMWVGILKQIQSGNVKLLFKMFVFMCLEESTCTLCWPAHFRLRWSPLTWKPCIREWWIKIWTLYLRLSLQVWSCVGISEPV